MIRKLIQLWDSYAELGVNADLNAREARSVGLINRISLVWILVILLTLPLNWVLAGRLAFIAGILNIFISLGVLQLNRLHKYVMARHYFVLYLFCLTVAGNLYSGPRELIHFLTIAVLVFLLFLRRKTILRYMGLLALSFAVIAWYQWNHLPFYYHDPHEDMVSNMATTAVLTFGLFFPIFIFYRGLYRQYETQLGQQMQALHTLNQDLEAQKGALQSTLEQLKAMQAQLVEAEKMASLGQLTAGIAHELNNPINFVASNIGPLKRDLAEIQELVEKMAMLEEENFGSQVAEIKQYIAEIDPGLLNEEINSLLAGIEDGASRTREIVAGLRNFSRLDEDEFKLADVHEGLDSTLALLHNKIKKSATVHKDYGATVEVDCLPGKLNQVFMNLIVNALQAIEGKGSGEKGNIWIQTRSDEDQLYIHIRDDGMGMPESVKKRIFEPFFTTKPIGEGTGLGLAIVHGIIQQHKGRIAVESEAGEGTTFRLTLPLTHLPQENEPGAQL